MRHQRRGEIYIREKQIQEEMALTDCEESTILGVSDHHLREIKKGPSIESQRSKAIQTSALKRKEERIKRRKGAEGRGEYWRAELTLFLNLLLESRLLVKERREQGI